MSISSSDVSFPAAAAMAPPPMPPGNPVLFRGNGEDFVGLCIRGALLELVTFGFYRFWLATDIRRRLWTSTSLDGEALEYTGRGRELLIGFLFALAIIAPLQIVYFLVGLEAERYQAFASFPLFLFYALFGQFALYRARRYRLTRTIWRGIRFWMKGSGWNYAFRWAGWSIVALLTIGLAYPWMRASLERYKMRNTFYGDLQGAFEGRGWEFFQRGIGFWLLGMAPFAVIGVGFALDGAAHDPIMGLGIASFVIVPFLWPFFRAVEWRWWANGVRFGDVRVASRLGGGGLLKLYLKTYGMTLVVFLAMGIAVGTIITIVATTMGFGMTSISPRNLGSLSNATNIFVAVMGVIGYLVILLSVGVVVRYYLTFRMWGLIAGAMSFSRLDALNGVAARGEAANALGEGLADSLDVAGF
jgi:uncharacterized membrane protein YjgN (DUF898 family)